MCQPAGFYRHKQLCLCVSACPRQPPKPPPPTHYWTRTAHPVVTLTGHTRQSKATKIRPGRRWRHGSVFSKLRRGGRDGERSEGNWRGGSEQILNESRLAGYVGEGLEAGDQVKLITAGFLIALYLWMVAGERQRQGGLFRHAEINTPMFRWLSLGRFCFF